MTRKIVTRGPAFRDTGTAMLEAMETTNTIHRAGSARAAAASAEVAGAYAPRIARRLRAAVVGTLGAAAFGVTALGAVLLGIVVLGLSLVLSGCSAQPASDGSEQQSTAPADGTMPADEPGAQPTEGVSEECLAVFPAAGAGTGAPDASSVLPAGWPDAPEGSELCLTSTGFGDNPTKAASYVTDLGADELIAHYEQALADAKPERIPSPLGGGDMLEGSAHGVGFQIKPADGGFVISVKADS